MRFRFIPIISMICLAGLMSIPAMAATSENDSINVQLHELQNEVNALKKQINHQTQVNAETSTTNTSNATQSTDVKTVKPDPVTPTPQVATGPKHITNDTPPSQTSSDSSQQPLYLPIDLEVPGQSFVSTGPYVGVPFQFAGTDLIINSPSVNTDLQLLNIRKKILQQVNKLTGDLGGKTTPRSHLLLSGLVEAQINHTSIGGGSNVSDIDVSNVSLDWFFIGPSDWTLGFVELSYDNGLPLDNFVRVSHSRIFVNKAFITIGNFAVSPFYATIGQFYVPFGYYSTFAISDPLTKLFARTKARAIQGAFEEQLDNGFYGAAYAFRGDSRVSNARRINNGGLNFGYKFNWGCFKGRFGGGVIGNIADSVGEQFGNGFAFFERIDHRVPAYDIRGSFSIGDHIDLLGEFIRAGTEFDVNDMSYNGHGAKPFAFDIEASYSFSILCDKPSSIGIAYQKSNQALSLGIPLTRTLIVFNTSLFRNTLQSIEFRHDHNYAASDFANGPIGAIPVRGLCTSTACSASGLSDNAITAQFDYYF